MMHATIKWIIDLSHALKLLDNSRNYKKIISTKNAKHIAADKLFTGAAVAQSKLSFSPVHLAQKLNALKVVYEYSSETH